MKMRLLDGDIAEYSSSLIDEANNVGQISNDRSAVVGSDGWCFIYDGSNHYRAGYLDADVNGTGSKWATLIEQRIRSSTGLGVKFLQVIVPNKLSIQTENFPEQLPADTTYILQNFLTSPVAAEVLIPLREFRRATVRDTVFRRNDSHLTLGGNALLTELILDKLGIKECHFDTIVTSGTEHVGDLGEKFVPPIKEILVVPTFSHGLFDEKNFSKVRETMAASVTGTSQVFVNASAPIKEKLVVFGNSFFERVPSWGLSPFFASLFSEFHFLWSSGVDFEYIAQERPGYVIAQTCERFMPKLPEDRYYNSNSLPIYWSVV